MTITFYSFCWEDLGWYYQMIPSPTSDVFKGQKGDQSDSNECLKFMVVKIGQTTRWVITVPLEKPKTPMKPWAWKCLIIWSLTRLFLRYTWKDLYFNRSVCSPWESSGCLAVWCPWPLIWHGRHDGAQPRLPSAVQWDRSLSEEVIFLIRK